MAGYNRVVLIGNLTRDPEYKQLTSGQAVSRLGLATNRQFKNRQTGSMVQEVCYVDIDVWGAQAESCKQYLKKGSPVLIEGRLKFDTWEDTNGQTRTKHSIVADRVVFLSGGSQAEETQPEMGMQEKELYNQIDQIKNRQAAVQENRTVDRPKKTKKADTAGEISFPDEQPFAEDLPF
jgi:single-strand DNA-binding protein